jgi:CarD family transcriptional regulator
MSVRFELHEKVVYPGHGVAKINRIVEKTISGKVTILYELKFINKEMTILVPINSLDVNGIRALSSHDNIENVFRLLAQPCPKRAQQQVTSNWKHRNKAYQGKLKENNLQATAEIYRDLKSIEKNKELSFCEKNLLVQAEMLLAQEIAHVQKIGEEKAIEHLRSFFGASVAHGLVYKAV